MNIKMYIGKVRTKEEFYVYDSKGLVFRFFSTYEKAEKFYIKMKDVFSIKDSKNTFLDVLKKRREIEYAVYREYRNKVLSGNYTKEDSANERTRFYSYQLIEDLIELYMSIQGEIPTTQGKGE